MTSFHVTPNTPVGSAGVRSDLLRSVYNRTTLLASASLLASDTSPSRASPANNNSSPRGSQASVTSTGSSSSSPRVSDGKDTAGLTVLTQQVSYVPVWSDTERIVNKKGKCIYIALIFVVNARRSGMDHTVLPAITPVPAFTS